MKWTSNQSTTELQPSRNGRQCALIDPSQSISSGPAYRNQIISSFYHSHFSVNERNNHFKVDVFPSLFTEIAALPRKTLMLEKSIAAISCIFLGKVNHNDNLLRHGLGLHNNAIKHMSNTLGRKAYNEDVLYTSMIFQELEVKPFTC